MLLLAGCGPRIGGGELATQATGAPLVVDLPALTVDYDRSGTAHVGSVSVAELGAVVGTDLTLLNLDREQMIQVTAANLQSIQLTNRPQQLLIVINERPLPRLAWDDTSLAAGMQLLEQVTTQSDLPVDIPTLLPVLTNLGGGLTLRFPGAAGASSTSVVEEPRLAAAAAQTAYLELIGTPPALTIDVHYQPDGRWTVDGLDATAWGALLPLPWERLNLEPETMQVLHEAGLRELIVRSNQTGLFVTVNGTMLPHLDWSQGELGHVIALAESSGLFTQFLGDTPTAYSLATTLAQLMPMLQVTEMTLRVQFSHST